MPAEQEATQPRSASRALIGLEILCEKAGPEGKLASVGAQDLSKELRERFWIRQASDAGARPKSWAEWFEVTEVFEGVEAKDIESFIRLENGGEASAGFDQQSFLTGLDLGIPGRAAQRRAADKVIAAVDRKLIKASYDGMSRRHGYGTLIVGLPLWFAAEPLNPLRAENVIDDFLTRVHVGLEPYARRLRRRAVPSGASWSFGRARWKARGSGRPGRGWTCTGIRRMQRYAVFRSRAVRPY